MKRVLVAVFSIMILIGTATTALAQNLTEQVVIDGKTMNLSTVNVNLDGKIIKADVPSVIYNTRTLVPIRLISESLGAEVGWDDATQSSTIKTSDKLIVVKVDSSKITVNGEQKDLPDNVPAKLMSTSKSDGSRIMVPLRFVSETLGAKVEWDSKTSTAIVESNKGNTDTAIKPESKPEVVKSNKIKSIVTKNIETSKIPQIHIEAENEVKYVDMSINDLSDVVVEIEGILSDQVHSLNIDNDVIKSVSAIQLPNNNNKATIRVTISLKKKISHKISKSNNSLNIDFVNEIQGIEKQVINGREAIVIKNAYETEIRSFSLSSPERWVVDIRNTNLKNVGNPINTDIVKELRTSQYTGGEYPSSEQVSRVVLDISENYENPKIETERRGNDIIVYVAGTKKAPVVVPPVIKPPTTPTPPTPQPNDDNRQKVVVIDAGHGGSDPGAVKNGLNEKDLTLKVALKTEEKLKNLGYKVIMVRTTDTRLAPDTSTDLRNRANLANSNNVDAFLSIHFNSGPSAATGIETYYTSKSGQDRAGFAGAIQSELIKLTGAVDRKVKTANFAVTRQTNMVSALTELGFISNPKDAKEIATDSYLEKCATAIANGIHKFLSK